MTTPPPLFWTLVVFITVGYGLLWWLVNRVSRDQWLQRILLISYSLHALLAVALYVISYWQWPILSSLQTQRGFWSFGLDAYAYHYYGTRIAEAWRMGFELPDPELGFEYFAVVAGLYRLLGSHPLYPILLNGWLVAVNGLLVYLIGIRLFDRRAALWGGLLASCWPSSFIWSAQLLKDALNWFLISSAVLLIASVIPGSKTPRRSWMRGALLYLLLGSVVIALTRLRFYIGSSFSLAAIAVLVPAAGYALLRKQIVRAVRLAGIALLVGISMLFARTLDTFALLSPANPEVAHYELALQYWEEDRLEEAVFEFSRAVVLRPGYLEAYLALAAIDIQQAKWEAAIKAYKNYLQQASPKQPSPINTIIARLYIESGNGYFRDRRIAEAVDAYEQAVVFDPWQAEAFANLGLALAKSGRFELAFEMSARALGQSRPGVEEERIKRLIAKTYVEEGNYHLKRARSTGTVESRRHLEAAIEASERALAFDPSLVDAVANLGIAWRQLGEFDRVLELFHRALELNRTEAEQKRVRGLIAQTYVEKARKDLRRESQAAKEERRGIRNEYVEAALATCQQAFAVDPSIPPPYAQVGLLLAEVQEVGRAHQMFERAFEPTQPAIEQKVVDAISEAYVAKANFELLHDNRAEAMTSYARAVRLNSSLRSSVLEAGGLALEDQPPLRPISLALEHAQEVVPPGASERAPTTPAPVPASERAPTTPARVQADSLGRATDLSIPEPLSANGDKILDMALSLFSSRTGYGAKRIQRRRYDFSRFDNQALQIASETTPESLAYRREGFIAAGGYSLMDSWAHISTPEKLLRYLPRALAIGLLAPFPWQWFDTKGSTGAMRTFAGVEMVLLYLLVPAILCGVWRVARQRRLESLFLLAFIGFTAVPISLVVANLGTLFRLRLLFLLPLLVIAGAGEPLGVYGRMGQWVKRVCGLGTRRVAATQQEGLPQAATTLQGGAVSSAFVKVIEEPRVKD